MSAKRSLAWVVVVGAFLVDCSDNTQPRVDAARVDAIRGDARGGDLRRDVPYLPGPDARGDRPGPGSDTRSDATKKDGLAADQATCTPPCDDGLACTDDLCSGGQCSHKTKTGFCLIGGACFKDGDKKAGSVCQGCASASSDSAWSPVDEGQPCDDGQACSHTDKCTAGTCAGTSYTCDDNLACTTDTCTGKPGIVGCSYALKPSQCLIAGACFAGGTKHSKVPFLQCQPALSVNDWSLVGTVATIAGSAPAVDGGSNAGFVDNCAAVSAKLNQPTALVLDGNKVYVSDLANYRVRKIETSWITTLFGTGTAGFDTGAASVAKVYMVQGMALYQDRLYFSDYSTTKSYVRYFDKITGQVGTLVGGDLGSGDGNFSAATFKFPLGMAVTSGKMYVADAGNNKIRQIDLASQQVTTFAGTGAAGFQNGPAAAATFTAVFDLALGPSGELYVLESGDDTGPLVSSCVRKIEAGQVSTVAGVCGQNGFLDGAAGSAKFYVPRGIAVGKNGELYVADSKNQRIRVIYDGKVVTLTGTGSSASVDGPVTAAAVVSPQGIAVDGFGNVYFAERWGNHVRVAIP